MSYNDRLVEEISKKLDALEKRKQPLDAKWITQAICIDHDEGLADNDHRDFWEHCGRSATRSAVTTCINKRMRDSKTRNPKQATLPGFVWVQHYYVVQRDGSEVGIPTPLLSIEELDQKIVLYRAMATGCQEHADELERYKSMRIQDLSQPSAKSEALCDASAN